MSDACRFYLQLVLHTHPAGIAWILKARLDATAHAELSASRCADPAHERRVRAAAAVFMAMAGLNGASIIKPIKMPQSSAATVILPNQIPCLNRLHRL